MGRLSCCLSVPRDARTLENFIFENLKISHDEFLYDESLNFTTAIYTCLLDFEPHIYFLLLMSIECGQAV